MSTHAGAPGTTPFTLDGRVFAAPGPGSWELDAVHFPRPLTRYVADVLPGPFKRGFAEGTASYGLMFSHFEPVFLHGIWYHQPVVVGAPRDASGPPPKLVLQLMTRLHPTLRRRLSAARSAFEHRIWREDLREWDEVAKPTATREHRRLQADDPVRMAHDELVSHLVVVRDQLARMWYQHHRWTASACMPVGDFLAHARDWTGRPFGDLLQLLRGASPISRGAVELDELASAVRADAAARRGLDAEPPAEALASLVARQDALGEAARAWIDCVGYRSVGYDVSDPHALDMPGVLVKALRAAVARDEEADLEEGALLREAISRVRAEVPAAERVRFDDLLAEARLAHRLRDERGTWSDAWATGLARRALLAAGARLESLGRLDEAALALEATHDELVALLAGAPGPSGDELREHRRWRTTRQAAEAPAWLGAPPAPPPPSDWLPPHARRAARAMDAYLEALFAEPPQPEAHPAAGRSDAHLTGLGVSPGTYEGRARLVKDASGLAHVEHGDVLVTRATSATFNVVLPLLGAIVTDRGGQLCHAAIVAREHGIPGVVGTREATARIPDGARVRVDGTAGRVWVLA